MVTRHPHTGMVRIVNCRQTICHRCRVRHLDSSSGDVVRVSISEWEQYPRRTPEERPIASIL